MDAMVHLDDAERNSSPANLILVYLKDQGIGMEKINSLGGIPVEIVANHITGNHPLASVGIRAAS